MDKFRGLFRKIVLPIYWAFLTYMLLKPGIENQEYWFMFPGIDKIIHLSIFAFLGFCISISFIRLHFFYFLLIILLYGISTEVLQEVMGLGRSFEFLDILADILGSLIGYIIYKFVLKYFFN
ncbi:VanZ family protein [Halpernia sp.]|uniref:VanZ family protein n=1 Tax=Halpernia sp. TaxID=2782209 RepID=UPI003A8F8226